MKQVRYMLLEGSEFGNYPYAYYSYVYIYLSVCVRIDYQYVYRHEDRNACMYMYVCSVIAFHGSARVDVTFVDIY